MQTLFLLRLSLKCRQKYQTHPDSRLSLLMQDAKLRALAPLPPMGH